MGMEVTDICMDNEPNCITIYSNGIPHDASSDTVPNGHDVAVSHEQINQDPKLLAGEDGTELKVYEVKECTTEIVSENCHVENFEPALPGKKIGSPKENVQLGNSKEKNNKLRLPVKHASKNVAGSIYTKCTVPQPFALATEKRASCGTRPSGAEPEPRTGIRKSSNAKGPSSNIAKRIQSMSLVSRKPLQPDNKKHPYEEDTYSVASSMTSAQTKSRTTVASAPTFRCSERAEKRREFYTKLEEKHQALEAEKTQSEARSKEEKEAAIKQLRKSLMFKAIPMPSFYHGGPPLKSELKKAPPTRAKSPNLGRRKSCRDAAAQREKVKGASDRGSQHSLGSHKKDSTSPSSSTTLSKD